jgi:Cof subfamily protein (haloacid dehalogenase superfamily)
MNIKLIAFDLDGTALNSKKELSPRTLAALDKARAAGILLVPCTGREIYNMPSCVFAYPFPCIIADNGTIVFSLPERDILYSRSFDRETAQGILAWCRTLKAMVFGTDGLTGAMDSKGLAWQEEATLRMIDRHRNMWHFPVEDLGARTSAREFCKFVAIFPDAEDRLDAFGLSSKFEKADFTSSEHSNIEIMPRGANKADALRFMADRTGVPMEQVMAIGDNYNDIEMIKAAGRGVAMANAVDKLKEAADEVTLSNDEDGVALAIESAL